MRLSCDDFCLLTHQLQNGHNLASSGASVNQGTVTLLRDFLSTGNHKKRKILHNALLFVCEEYDDQDSSQDDERRQHCYGGDHAGVDDAVASSADGLPAFEKGAGGAILEADGERVEHASQAHVLPDSALRAHGRHAIAA